MLRARRHKKAMMETSSHVHNLWFPTVIFHIWLCSPLLTGNNDEAVMWACSLKKQMNSDPTSPRAITSAGVVYLGPICVVQTVMKEDEEKNLVKRKKENQILETCPQCKRSLNNLFMLETVCWTRSLTVLCCWEFIFVLACIFCRVCV